MTTVADKLVKAVRSAARCNPDTVFAGSYSEVP